jgi:hypothetical protein
VVPNELSSHVLAPPVEVGGVRERIGVGDGVGDRISGRAAAEAKSEPLVAIRNVLREHVAGRGEPNEAMLVVVR